ncbi:hypothetical protein [Terrabacter carboxydivorans]|uniref:Uncharacterized protein n=1 Tax=Terrabacter carboxydivorans TaxID=619730 RepID=A0ABP5YMG9_9MICO
MFNSLVTRGAGRDPSQGTNHTPLEPIRPVSLEDEALREEIELLLDVIATVADRADHLTSEQVDAALRLPRRGRGRPWCDAPVGGQLAGSRPEVGRRRVG